MFVSYQLLLYLFLRSLVVGYLCQGIALIICLFDLLKMSYTTIELTDKNYSAASPPLVFLIVSTPCGSVLIYCQMQGFTNLIFVY